MPNPAQFAPYTLIDTGNQRQEINLRWCCAATSFEKRAADVTRLTLLGSPRCNPARQRAHEGVLHHQNSRQGAALLQGQGNQTDDRRNHRVLSASTQGRMGFPRLAERASTIIAANNKPIFTQYVGVATKFSMPPMYMT
jgi:hypothetical protein